jgi:hypothetical protein
VKALPWFVRSRVDHGVLASEYRPSEFAQSTILHLLALLSTLDLADLLARPCLALSCNGFLL